MIKCLILGGTGFLGINLCKKLIDGGNEVSVFARNGGHAQRLCNLFPAVEFIGGDFSHKLDWDIMLKNIDVVFHLISTTNPSNKDLSYEFESNVLPTINLLEGCKKNKVRVIYFSSGGTVYGMPRYLPIDEEHRTEPISAYGIHKLSIEKCIEYYGRTYGVDYYILRISNPYGAYQNPLGNQGVIAVFLAKILQNKTVEIWGDGSTIREYVFVDDLVSACMLLLSYVGGHRVFNIGSGRGYSLKEVIQLIKAKCGYSVNVNFVEKRIQDVSANILDINLARKELQWEPTVDLSEGLFRMVDMWSMQDKEFLFL